MGRCSLGVSRIEFLLMADASPTHSGSPRLADYVALLRPAQWVKNVVVFAGPAAALRLFSVDGFSRSFLAFACFCLVASASYAINDCLDRRADALHPVKKNRPIARGAISPGMAVMLAICLFLTGVLLAGLALGPLVATVVSAYFLMILAYSIALKRQVLLDVIVIASGFVLRAWAGALAVGVVTSEWLIACMFTLCLFMGFGKRRCELVMMGGAEQAGHHRKTLLQYTPDLLNHLITVSAGIAIVTFLLYTLDTTSTTAFRKEHLFFTLPVVVYGVFRYAMLCETGDFSGPTEIILKDRGMALTIMGWTAAALLIAYQESILGPGAFDRWVDFLGISR
ncbi:MAG: decaprenyl-phosphate phosphoribosyltransferase [Phycisphaerae bacterium]